MGIALTSGLTPKQEAIAQGLAKQIIETGETNQTEIGLQVYDTKNPGSARTLVSRELQNVDVRERVEELLESAGLSLNRTMEELSSIATHEVSKITGDTKLKAIIETLKLYNAYPQKKTMHIRADFNTKVKDMSFKDLKSTLNRLRERNNSMLTDLENEDLSSL